MIWQQLRQHFVALLSLVIAIIALTYTTWREEETERNRNKRVAAFELLKNLGQLQILVNYSIYDPKNTMANPLLGWGHVAIISDMGALLSTPLPEQTQQLANVWGENVRKLQTEREAQDEITKEIDTCRESVLKNLQQLR